MKLKRILPELPCILALSGIALAGCSAPDAGPPAPADPRAKRLTPVMGWTSRNYLQGAFTEEGLIAQMDALVSTGLRDAGYTYFNIDGGFFGSRDGYGQLRARPVEFPGGMGKLADAAHERGLFAGIYTDAGLHGYEERHLRTLLIDWDYDFLKVDRAGGKEIFPDMQALYTNVGNIIERLRDEKGKYIIYNVCSREFPGEWIVDVADSWRIQQDVFPSWPSVTWQIDTMQNEGLAKYHGPGHISDLDMMQLNSRDEAYNLGPMTYNEDKSHFSMWCMMSAPLLLGNDLTRISEETLAILKNAEMIAVNQDAACLPATLAVKDNNKEIWVKDLGGQNSGTKAVALLNRSNSQLSITVDFVKDLRFSGPVKIRDLWAHENPAPASSYTTAEMPARGIVVLKVEGDYIPPAGNAAGPTPVRAPSGYMDIANAKRAVAGGATLVDVRSAEEYNAFHIDGAINIDYAVIPEEAGEALPDKNALIIVYCSAGKRSAQALSMLQELGYGKVYNIGPLSDWLNSSP